MRERDREIEREILSKVFQVNEINSYISKLLVLVLLLKNF